jgi:pimeloyl-ACP methyl ester carboxylesterase
MSSDDDGISAVMIDPTSHTMSVTPIGDLTAATIAVDKDGRLYVSDYHVNDTADFINGESVTTVDRGSTITVFSQVPTGTPSDEPDYIYTAPYDAATLYSRLREKSDQTVDGMYMEKLVDAHGQERLIVFIGGTTPDWIGPNQPILTNLEGYAMHPKDHQLAMIDVALGIDRSSGAPIDNDTPIMLVGYSQGGMDAQNIAANAESFGYNVTTVITYGSPAVQWPIEDVDMAFLWDYNDPVTALSRPDAALATLALQFHGHGGVYSPTDPLGINVHGNPQTYRAIGQQFEESTDPAFKNVRSDIKGYVGTVTEFGAYEVT